MVEEKLAQIKANKTPSMTIIATKGTLDWAYPPFILSSTAAALGWDVSIFFTFYGLQLLKKDISDLKISPLGNPGMPMKMPFGPEWFKGINWNIPNLVQAGMPGFESFATTMMQQTIRNNGVAGIAELRSLCLEAGVNMIGCQMTVRPVRLQPRGFHPRGEGILRRRLVPADGAGKLTSRCLSSVVQRTVSCCSQADPAHVQPHRHCASDAIPTNPCAGTPA
jgi:peroxiredoxin family protein